VESLTAVLTMSK